MFLSLFNVLSRCVLYKIVIKFDHIDGSMGNTDMRIDRKVSHLIKKEKDFNQTSTDYTSNKWKKESVKR